MFEEDAVPLVEACAALGMGDDRRLVNVEHRFAEAPDAALVEGAPAGAARIERCAVDADRVAPHLEQAAAVARVADLVRGVLAVAGNAVQSHYVHDRGGAARAPCRAIGPTCDVVAMPNAFCIAAAQPVPAAVTACL